MGTPMRPWRHLDGWDQVLARLKNSFRPGGRYEANWYLGIAGLLLQNGTAAIHISVSESPAKIFVSHSTGQALTGLGSWERRENGSGFSQQWGTANREEMVERIEDVCKSALGF
jgi:hypothetical protein